MAFINFQPKDYFNTKLYTGNGGSSTDSITGINFQPDWLWIKARNNTYNHNLYDSVRGLSSGAILSNLTDAQDSTQRISSFDSDGFTLPATNYTYVNASGTNYVAWNWKANGQGSANTDGTINTTYTSANTTSGFSISQYTGTGANATVGHGLGVAPKMVIVKRTNTTGGWTVYHSSVGNTKYLYLHTTNAEATASSIWNNTSPTSSVFTVGNDGEVNASGSTYIAYCFAEKTGFSKFMGWSGSGSTDGTFLYTGFKPALFIYKVASGTTGGWGILDNKRDTFNPVDNTLSANTSGAEFGDHDVDFLSNGLKIRSGGGDINLSGATYIGMAFAEEPLVSSNGVPAVAR